MSTENEAGPAAGGSTLKPLAVLLVALLVLAAVLNYIDRLAINAIAPTVKAQFALSGEEWGWMNSAFNFVYIFSSLLGGMWIDRVGVRRGLLISTLVWSLAAAGHAFATGFWSLCFWRMMLALGEGPGAASLLKGVRRLMPPHLRDTGNGLIGAGWTAGMAIAPLVIGPVTDKYGWQAGFLATSSLCLAWLPCWVFLAFRPGVPLGAENVTLKAGSDLKPRALQRNSLALWATLLAILFTVPPTVFMNGFLSLYLSGSHGLTQPEIIAVMWKPYVATDGGQLFGGFAVFLLLRVGWRYLSARTLIVTAGFLGSCVMLKVNQSPNAQDAIFWLCVSRFFFQAAYTVVGAYALESVSETQTALLAGMMNATFSVCNVVFNPLIGRIADRHGYSPVITIITWSPPIGLAFWLVLSQLHARKAAVAESAAVG